jgi:hypothetical protein
MGFLSNFLNPGQTNKQKSNTVDTTINDSRQTSIATDKRQVSDNGGVSINNDTGAVTINSSFTDNGTVSEAFGFSNAALGVAGDAFSQAGQMVTSNAKTALDFGENAIDKVTSILGNVLGFAKGQADKGAESQRAGANLVQSAFQSAQDGANGNRTIMIVGFVVVGAIGAAYFASKK